MLELNLLAPSNELNANFVARSPDDIAFQGQVGGKSKVEPARQEEWIHGFEPGAVLRIIKNGTAHLAGVVVVEDNRLLVSPNSLVIPAIFEADTKYAHFLMIPIACNIADSGL